MDKITKSIIKTFSVLFVVFLCTTNLQAKESDYTETKAPPVVHMQADTLPLVKLSTTSHDSVSVYEAVEDTVLPPCDILFFKSGKLEYCKIIETTETTVSYKMCDYLDGPTVIANKSTVHKIRYANGKEEVVTVEQQASVNAYVKARKDPMATWALICSLGGLLIFPAAIAGVILGIISLRRIKKSDGALRGKGAAKAAIIIGGILLLLYALSL